MIAIWQYTKEKWGREQADRYLSEINKTIASLTSSKAIGRELKFVRLGLRKLRHKRHFVYFRIGSEHVEVTRVLHERQDETLHLS